MPNKLLHDARFHDLLKQIDQTLATEARLSNCPFCKGSLHLSSYPRSPHGVPSQFREQYEERLSFCCANCRKRTTPLSVKFFGRRWYVAPVLILISALQLGINERRIKQVKQHFGIRVSGSTWKRWRCWWQHIFRETPFWKQNGALIIPAVAPEALLPRVLFASFQKPFSESMVLLLKFLSPMTAGILRAV